MVTILPAVEKVNIRAAEIKPSTGLMANGIKIAGAKINIWKSVAKYQDIR